MMKKLYGTLLVILMAGILLVPETTALMQETSTVDIVSSYYNALNAGMIDEVMAYIDEGAEFINPTGTYIGHDEIRDSLVGLTNDAITFDLYDFFACNNRVTYSYAVLQNGSRIDVGDNGLTIVEDGKITFDGTLTTERVPYAPGLVYQAYYDAINAGDIATAMTFVTDNVVISDPNGTTSGKEAVSAYWQGLADAGFTFEIVEMDVRGNRVYNSYRVLQNGSLIDEGDDGIGIIENGLIVFDGLLPSAPQPPTDPTGVVETFYDAVNTGNLDSALSFVAEDALFINPIGQFAGKDEVSENLAGVIRDGLTFDFSNFRVCDGRVVMAYEVSQNGARLDAGDGGLTIVEDGKIIFDGTLDTEPTR
jgi:ketosteroid isomerase-like protein